MESLPTSLNSESLISMDLPPASNGDYPMSGDSCQLELELHSADAAEMTEIITSGLKDVDCSKLDIADETSLEMENLSITDEEYNELMEERRQKINGSGIGLSAEKLLGTKEDESARLQKVSCGKILKESRDIRRKEKLNKFDEVEKDDYYCEVKGEYCKDRHVLDKGSDCLKVEHVKATMKVECSDVDKELDDISQIISSSSFKNNSGDSTYIDNTNRHEFTTHDEDKREQYTDLKMLHKQPILSNIQEKIESSSTTKEKINDEQSPINQSENAKMDEHWNEGESSQIPCRINEENDSDISKRQIMDRQDFSPQQNDKGNCGAVMHVLELNGSEQDSDTTGSPSGSVSTVRNRGSSKQKSNKFSSSNTTLLHHILPKNFVSSSQVHSPNNTTDSNTLALEVSIPSVVQDAIKQTSFSTFSRDVSTDGIQQLISDSYQTPTQASKNSQIGLQQFSIQSQTTPNFMALQNQQTREDNIFSDTRLYQTESLLNQPQPQCILPSQNVIERTQQTPNLLNYQIQRDHHHQNPIIQQPPSDMFQLSYQNQTQLTLNLNQQTEQRLLSNQPITSNQLTQNVNYISNTSTYIPVSAVAKQNNHNIKVKTLSDTNGKFPYRLNTSEGGDVLLQSSSYLALNQQKRSANNSKHKELKRLTTQHQPGREKLMSRVGKGSLGSGGIKKTMTLSKDQLSTLQPDFYPVVQCPNPQMSSRNLINYNSNDELKQEIEARKQKILSQNANGGGISSSKGNNFGVLHFESGSENQRGEASGLQQNLRQLHNMSPSLQGQIVQPLSQMTKVGVQNLEGCPSFHKDIYNNDLPLLGDLNSELGSNNYNKSSGNNMKSDSFENCLNLNYNNHIVDELDLHGKMSAPTNNSNVVANAAKDISYQLSFRSDCLMTTPNPTNDAKNLSTINDVTPSHSDLNADNNMMGNELDVLSKFLDEFMQSSDAGEITNNNADVAATQHLMPSAVITRDVYVLNSQNSDISMRSEENSLNNLSRESELNCCSSKKQCNNDFNNTLNIAVGGAVMASDKKQIYKDRRNNVCFPPQHEEIFPESPKPNLPYQQTTKSKDFQKKEKRERKRQGQPDTLIEAWLNESDIWANASYCTRTDEPEIPLHSTPLQQSHQPNLQNHHPFYGHQQEQSRHHHHYRHQQQQQQQQLFKNYNTVGAIPHQGLSSNATQMNTTKKQYAINTSAKSSSSSSSANSCNRQQQQHRNLQINSSQLTPRDSSYTKSTTTKVKPHNAESSHHSSRAATASETKPLLASTEPRIQNYKVNHHQKSSPLNKLTRESHVPMSKLNTSPLQRVKVNTKGIEASAGNDVESLTMSLPTVNSKPYAYLQKEPISNNSDENSDLYSLESSNSSIEEKWFESLGKDEEGETPLHYMCNLPYEKYQEIRDNKNFNKVINHLSNQKQTALFVAVVMERPDVVEFFVQNGADVNIVCKSNPKKDGRACSEYHTALHEAVESGNLEIIQLFLNVDDTEIDSRQQVSYMTPLMLAMRDHSVINKDKVIKMLLKNGASLEKQDVEGRTPLMFMVMSGDVKLVKCILGNVGVQVARSLVTMFTKKTQMTCLHYAASLKGKKIDKQKKMELLKLLIEHGAEPNKMNIDKQSPRHLAPQEMSMVMSQLMTKTTTDGVESQPEESTS